MPARTALLLSILALDAAAAPPARAEEGAATWSRRELQVPLDHDRPEAETIRLTLELATPFDRERPTLLWVTDGQQFQMRHEGATLRLRDERLGLPADAVNVVGLLGRGFDDEVTGRLRDAAGEVDWRLAHRLLASRQWVGDLEAVRRALVGAEEKVLLYGVSGGGYLVHEYLARHGDRVLRAATEVAPVRPIDGWLGLFADPFWSEVAADGERGAALARVLAASPRRTDLVRLLQRQHYFVAAEDLAAQRRAAVDEIVRGDGAAIEQRLAAYQVEAMRELEASDLGIAIAVRMYEFCEPVLRHADLSGPAVHPNLENEATWAAPLLELRRRDEIPAVAFDRDALREVRAEILMLAGRRDQTADYRAQIALAAHYPRAELFLADDSHTLQALERASARRRLLSTFLFSGLGSRAMRSLLAELEPLRWSERGEP